MADEVNQDAEKHKLEKAARLFDIRRVIGGLFVVYGVIVTLLGLFDNQSEIDKASGVRINLWMGLSMLALGAFFLAWQWWRPAAAPTENDLADSDETPSGT